MVEKKGKDRQEEKKMNLLPKHYKDLERNLLNP